jgi:superfamily II DNA or RNA helicase
MPKEECDVYNIESVLGPVIYKLKSKELMDRGMLSKIKMLNVLLKYPDDVVKKNKNRPYIEELRTVYEYENRNSVFKYLFSKFKDGDNTLILCTQINHLKSIEKYLEENLDEKYMILNIYGKTKTIEREVIRKTLEKEKNVVLIGTFSTIGVGFSVKRINTLIFGSSYKSYIKIIQACGRGLRKSIYKKHLLLIDLVDDLRFTKRTGTIGENHLYKHFEKRKEYYDEQEFGYVTTTYKV